MSLRERGEWASALVEKDQYEWLYKQAMVRGCSIAAMIRGVIIEAMDRDYFNTALADSTGDEEKDDADGR